MQPTLRGLTGCQRKQWKMLALEPAADLKNWTQTISNPCIFYTNIIFQRQFSFTSVFGCTIQTFAIDAYPLPHILNYCSPGSNMNRVSRMKIAYTMHHLQDRGQVGSMYSKYKHQTSSNIRINMLFSNRPPPAILQRPPGLCWSHLVPSLGAWTVCQLWRFQRKVHKKPQQVISRSFAKFECQIYSKPKNMMSENSFEGVSILGSEPNIGHGSV